MAANKQHKPLTARGRFWQRHLQRWRQSGLSQVQYCRQQRLSAAAFGWWKGQLSAESSPGIKPKRGVSDEIADPRGPFVEVAFSDSSPTGGSDEFPYEITVAPQRCLRLGRHDELERVQEILHQDPLSGHLFVFVNRRGDRVKILFWDRSGFASFYKRLEEGVFHLPPEDVGGVEIDVPRLTLILEGIDLSEAKQQKRFSRPRAGT